MKAGRDQLIVEIVAQKIQGYEKWIVAALVLVGIVAIWLLAPGWIADFNRAPL